MLANQAMRASLNLDLSVGEYAESTGSLVLPDGTFPQSGAILNHTSGDLFTA